MQSSKSIIGQSPVIDVEVKRWVGLCVDSKQRYESWGIKISGRGRKTIKDIGWDERGGEGQEGEGEIGWDWSWVDEAKVSTIWWV